MSSVLESQIQAAEQECLNSWKRGPTRLRWSKLPPQVGEPAPDFDLSDSSGKGVHLSDFWRDRPALLMFWRHYGCGCGLERASRLQKEYADYTLAGVNVVIIGQGEPVRTAAYAQEYGLPCPVLCDPAFRVYEAYGLLEGKPSQIVYDAPEELLRCDYEAFVQLAKVRREAGRPLVDSPWQLPGEFVVDREGVIRLVYRYQYCEDFPNPLVLLAAIGEAVSESA
ncbi:MAG: redoxin domain-containing protein [Anaerolineales bacterium]